MAVYSTRKAVYDLPVQLVTVNRFRDLLETFGRDSNMVILRPVEGGYIFRSEPVYQPRRAFEIKSERSGQRRVFKSVESALNVARSFGFSSVQIELVDELSTGGVCS